MEVYKFETTVQENGMIQIPEIARFAHQQIEVFIVVKAAAPLATSAPPSIDSFLSKWRGTLQGFNPDELKMQSR